MSDSTSQPAIGEIVWQDLVVKDAGSIKDFYCEVVGWRAEPHPMDDYHDFDIIAPESGKRVTGICHARDTNADAPPQWLLFVKVADVNKSAERCRQLGGSLVDGPRMMGNQNFCIIRDPAGAVLALVSSQE